MKGKLKFTMIALVWSMMLIAAYVTSAQTGATREPRAAKKSALSAVSTPLVPVTGGGTIGQLTKWIGINPSDGFVIGDSIITETSQGQIGIGTTTPTSTLTVAGTIEALDGYKFPDGTTQTTAFDPNKVVRSINGLRGDLNLAAGTNITVTPSGGTTLTIAAPDVLTSVSHNTTLTGNGTEASPLGIADGSVVRGLNGLTDQVTLAAGSGITITPAGNTLTLASTATDPEKNAFQRSVTVSLPEHHLIETATINVPSGKRLVIEYVSIYVLQFPGTFLEDNDVNPIALRTTVNGVAATHHIQHGPIKDFFPVGAVDKPVRIYSDSDVAIEVQKSVVDSRVEITITVSGRLVDLP